MLCLYQYVSVFHQKYDPTLREIVLLLSGNGTHLIAQEKMGNLADFVDAMLNALRTIEMANCSQLRTSIGKHYHTQ